MYQHGAHKLHGTTEGTKKWLEINREFFMHPKLSLWRDQYYDPKNSRRIRDKYNDVMKKGVQFKEVCILY